MTANILFQADGGKLPIEGSGSGKTPTPDMPIAAEVANIGGENLAAAIAKLNEAKADLAEAIGGAHVACTHTVWVERPTFKVADWLSPHSAIRICKNCRAEIQDRGIYRDWLSHGEYSHNKPDAVELVLQPAQAGVSEIFALRLTNDPRPFFNDFNEVLAWEPEKP